LSRLQYGYSYSQTGQFPVSRLYGQVDWVIETTHQILGLKKHQVKSYEKLIKPWGFAGFSQTK
jgi:hypothetical protein